MSFEIYAGGEKHQQLGDVPPAAASPVAGGGGGGGEGDDGEERQPLAKYQSHRISHAINRKSLLTLLSLLSFAYIIGAYLGLAPNPWPKSSNYTSFLDTISSTVFGHPPTECHKDTHEANDPYYEPDEMKYIRLETLPWVGSKPGKKPSGQHGNRLIIIGDVHGGYDELITLLNKVDYDGKKGDHLVFTGDLVSKGPKSREVVKLARDNGASCVRGNHDDRVIRAWHRYHKKFAQERAEEGETESEEGEEEREEKGGIPAEIVAEIKDNEHEDITEGKPLTGSKKSKKKKKLSDLATAKQLSKEDVRYLEQCPLMLKVPGTGEDKGDMIIVHAGLVPGVELCKQDPFMLMNLRTLCPKTGKPSSHPKGIHWANVWNKVMSRLNPSEKRQTVVYGHYASEGLDIRKYSKGLDGNCVRGGNLAALVVEGIPYDRKENVERGESGYYGEGEGRIRMEVAKIKCRRYMD